MSRDVEDFEVIIDSLGNASLSFLSSAGVHSVKIFAEPSDATAHMQICLREDTWEKRARAIHAMVEIREMFMDDLSLDYTFTTSDECEVSSATAAQTREFAPA